MEIPGLLDPFRRHDAEGLHGDRGVLALPGPQLGLVGLEGGQVVAVPVLGLGPGQGLPGDSTLPNPRLADLVMALCVEGQAAQLGNGFDLVDADG
jgi:hypothetical protein